jgi:hypothetical protein
MTDEDVPAQDDTAGARPSGVSERRPVGGRLHCVLVVDLGPGPGCSTGPGLCRRRRIRVERADPCGQGSWPTRRGAPSWLSVMPEVMLIGQASLASFRGLRELRHYVPASGPRWNIGVLAFSWLQSAIQGGAEQRASAVSHRDRRREPTVSMGCATSPTRSAVARAQVRERHARQAELARGPLVVLPAKPARLCVGSAERRSPLGDRGLFPRGRGSGRVRLRRRLLR